MKDDFNRIAGKDIILEDLRQSCLHTNLSKLNQEPKWWDYIKEVHSECFGFISRACSKNAHEKLKLDFEATEKCVDESFLGSNRAMVDNLVMQSNAK